MANLRFYYGTMSSGKTMALLMAAHNLRNNAEKNIKLLKSSIDTKANDSVQTRVAGGIEQKVDVLLEPDKSLVDYFKKHAYKNTKGDDLWRALEPYAEFKPGELMHAFIDKPGYPVITNTGDNFDQITLAERPDLLHIFFSDNHQLASCFSKCVTRRIPIHHNRPTGTILF